MYVYMYVCIIYVCVYVLCMCVYMYVYLYVGMHQFCSIPKDMWQFVRKYLCSFNSELHNTTNWDSSDTYCSSCSDPTCYTNVKSTDIALTVCSQLSVSFCTARRNYKEAQNAVSRQLHWTWRGDKSATAEFLELCVICKCTVCGCYQLRYKLLFPCSHSYC